MVYYYLDIETFGEGDRPDPATDEIITIIYCSFNPATGKTLQEPTVLKSWESSEEDIVKQLSARMNTKNPFDFIPVGFSLFFDLWFLKAKFNKYCGTGLKERFYMERPHLDLKSVMVFANKGQFKGVRIGAEGNPVQDWYKYEDYSSIERHMREKLEKFTMEYRKWRKKLQ